MIIVDLFGPPQAPKNFEFSGNVLGIENDSGQWDMRRYAYLEFPLSPRIFERQKFQLFSVFGFECSTFSRPLQSLKLFG